MVISIAEVSPIIWLGNSGTEGEDVKLGAGLLGIVELGVSVVLGDEVGGDVGLGVGDNVILGVGGDVGLDAGEDVGVGDVNPRARVAYAAPVGLTVKFASFWNIIGLSMLCN
jgi:hypothetical protein